MNRLLNAFEKAYRSEEAKNLLRKDWREANLNAPHSTGFCYIAAEAAWHLLGREGIDVYCASYKEDDKPCTHWWLKSKNKIIDPTVTQYTEIGLKPPYHLGKRMGFLTKNPSKRAIKLMEIVRRYL